MSPCPEVRSSSDASTGTTVSASSSELPSANTIASATGMNSLPSRPCSVSSGRNTITMMTMPEVTGTTTSLQRVIDPVQERHVLGVAVVREMRDDVLHHHHGGVDQHADRDREAAEAHQVRRHAGLAHQHEGGERRQRQCQRDHQRGAPVAEEQDQQHDHQHGGFEQ